MANQTLHITRRVFISPRATCLALRAVRASAEIELFPVNASAGINNLIPIVSMIAIAIADHVNCVPGSRRQMKLLLKKFKTPRASASRNPKCDGRRGTAFGCTRLEKITKVHVTLGRRAPRCTLSGVHAIGVEPRP
jgi:hypothetical protein